MTARRVIDFREWMKDAPAARARAARIEAGFAEPYRRERPRDPVEAAFLREVGTPERLIGPVVDEDRRSG